MLLISVKIKEKVAHRVYDKSGDSEYSHSTIEEKTYHFGAPYAEGSGVDHWKAQAVGYLAHITIELISVEVGSLRALFHSPQLRL